MISPSAWRAAGATFRFEDVDVFYRRGGEGPALLCLHGFPTSSWDWHPLWDRLTPRFDVIAPDLIGLGFSSKPPRRDAYSIARQARMHEALLEHLGVGAAHAFAHDLGDTVLQEIIARQVDRDEAGEDGPRIRSAVYLNGGLFPETHRARPIQKALLGPLGPLLAQLTSRRRFDRTMTDIFGPDTPPSPETLDAFWQMLVADRGRRAIPGLIQYIRERRTHRERWVGALTAVPTRVIDGALDPVSGRHMAERFLELIPDGDVVVLDRLGHYPHVEDPDAVWDAFIDFHEDRLRSP